MLPDSFVGVLLHRPVEGFKLNPVGFGSSEGKEHLPLLDKNLFCGGAGMV